MKKGSNILFPQPKIKIFAENSRSWDRFCLDTVHFTQNLRLKNKQIANPIRESTYFNSIVSMKTMHVAVHEQSNMISPLNGIFAFVYANGYE